MTIFSWLFWDSGVCRRWGFSLFWQFFLLFSILSVEKVNFLVSKKNWEKNWKKVLKKFKIAIKENNGKIKIKKKIECKNQNDKIMRKKRLKKLGSYPNCSQKFYFMIFSDNFLLFVLFFKFTKKIFWKEKKHKFLKIFGFQKNSAKKGKLYSKLNWENLWKFPEEFWKISGKMKLEKEKNWGKREKNVFFNFNKQQGFLPKNFGNFDNPNPNVFFKLFWKKLIFFSFFDSKKW